MVFPIPVAQICWAPILFLWLATHIKTSLHTETKWWFRGICHAVLSWLCGDSYCTYHGSV